MIAYCGLNCDTCIAYKATQSGDDNELKKVAEIWSKEYNADVKSEHVICDGCKANKRQCFHCANSCNIRKCCPEKGHDFCIECDEFPCDDARFVVDNVPEAMANLKKATMR